MWNGMEIHSVAIPSKVKKCLPPVRILSFPNEEFTLKKKLTKFTEIKTAAVLPRNLQANGSKDSSYTDTFDGCGNNITFRNYHPKYKYVLLLVYSIKTREDSRFTIHYLPSIEAMILKAQLRWTGHIIRMNSDRIPKQLLYGVLSKGNRKQGRPLKRFKDCTKANIAYTGIATKQLEECAQDCTGRRALTRKAPKAFEAHRRANVTEACAKKEGSSRDTQTSRPVSLLPLWTCLPFPPWTPQSSTNPPTHIDVKLRVYKTVVLTSLLYGCETWTLYRRHIKLLERFHMRSLRSILGIKWQDMITNLEVLDRAETTSIEAMILKAQLRWTGHIIRMDSDRIPKQLLYGVLSKGKRKQGRPLKRFKECIKANIAYTGNATK
ncbi:hypothetical protein AWC38_SpisGene16303 [Stylophora pistillata]|uniref:Uncharacterized protein n=1 Tax=Stylophora pistillata TaxID=50429 RepID=A0A2B4RSP9_STYPI|nr:hypothetical protein AWC38_SpisGene16303 [Stylophora pistillata]